MEWYGMVVLEDLGVQVLAETPRPSELVWLDTLPVHFWPECQKWNGSV